MSVSKGETKVDMVQKCSRQGQRTSRGRPGRGKACTAPRKNVWEREMEKGVATEMNRCDTRREHGASRASSAQVVYQSASPPDIGVHRAWGRSTGADQARKRQGRCHKWLDTEHTLRRTYVLRRSRVAVGGATVAGTQLPTSCHPTSHSCHEGTHRAWRVGRTGPEGRCPARKRGVTVRHRMVGERIALGEQVGPLLTATLPRTGHTKHGSGFTVHTHTP